MQIAPLGALHSRTLKDAIDAERNARCGRKKIRGVGQRYTSFQLCWDWSLRQSDRSETCDDRFLLTDDHPLLVWLLFACSTDVNLLLQKKTPFHDDDLL